MTSEVEQILIAAKGVLCIVVAILIIRRLCKISAEAHKKIEDEADLK